MSDDGHVGEAPCLRTPPQCRAPLERASATTAQHRRDELEAAHSEFLGAREDLTATTAAPEAAQPESQSVTAGLWSVSKELREARNLRAMRLGSAVVGVGHNPRASVRAVGI